jgi:two-component system cell cycle sensor histidine kinase/response regulator CckA
VLFISGYTNDEVVRRGVTQDDSVFIQKPFAAPELMQKVRGLLDGESRGTGRQSPVASQE